MAAFLGNRIGGNRIGRVAMGGLVLWAVAGCGDRPQLPPSSMDYGSGEASAPPDSGIPGVPSDVGFSIVRQDILPGTMRILDVRLTRPVEEEVLEAIARHLRAQDPREYEAVYIVYYLPDMPPDDGGWATSHFTPELEVRILGVPNETDTPR